MSSPKEWVESFPSVPLNYVDALFEEFSGQVDAWYSHDWEKVGLKAGKICEIAFSIIDGFAAQKYPATPGKPRNFLDSCVKLESKYTNLSRSLRIQVPRILIGMYELRNNRSVGHVGSSVNPNIFDGEYFFRSSKWVVCELSRAICEGKGKSGEEGFYSSVNLSEIPIIWESSDIVRILKPDMTASEKTILVLAHYNSWIDIEYLRSCVEYKNKSNYKTKVIEKLHLQKFVEFSKDKNVVMILPPGIRSARKLHEAN